MTFPLPPGELEDVVDEIEDFVVDLDRLTDGEVEHPDPSAGGVPEPPD